MSQPMISVIVPVYNVERYLDKCIASLVNQTCRDLEIVLVDDGSTDRCGAICDAWGQQDDRIRVMHKANGGLSDARNAGMEIARGEWSFFLDSDDYLAPDTLERLFCAATECSCSIAVCNILRIWEDGETEPFYCPASEVTLLEGTQRFETLKQPSACNKLFRRELFEGLRFPKGKYYEDTFLYHILAHRANGIVLTGHNGYFYLSRRDSILGQPKYTERYFDFVEAVYERTTYLLEHQIPVYGEEACLSLYAAVASAEANIPRTPENKEKFLQMEAWYRTAYRYLMARADTSRRQKLRLILLRYLPRLHSRIY